MLKLRQATGASASPPPPDATVSSEYLHLLVLGAEGRGLNLKLMFASSGIDPAVLNRRGARVGIRAVDRVWNQLASRLDDPLFGLRLVDAMPFGAADVMDYVIRTSANVGEALQKCTRYAPLLSTAEEAQVVVSGNQASFRLEVQREIPYAIELVLSMFAQRTPGHFGPSWAIKEVSFAHDALGPRDAYDRTFHAPVRFGMPFSEVIFDRELLEMPLASADPRLNAILTAQAEALRATVARPPAAPSFVETVKQALNNRLNIGDFSLSGLADHLGMSARTLQRRLRAEGLTHRTLVSRLRHDLAVRSLATPITQNQIARTLGYSGTGAFRRAFKSWAGMSPAALRRPGTRSRNGENGTHPHAKAR